MILTSTFFTFLFHYSTLYFTPHHKKRLAQYYLSFLHSVTVVFLYLSDFSLKEYIDIIEPQDEIIMGIHIGYFLSDGLYEFYIREWSYVFHHLFSVYYIYLNYAYSTIGLMERGMLVAETSAMVLNLRSIVVKHKKKKYITLELLNFITYFGLRGLVSPYYFTDYAWNYGFDQKQMAVIFMLFWTMSLNWSYKMYKSTRDLCRLNFRSSLSNSLAG